MIKFNKRQKLLRRRIVEIAYKNKYCWIGSCFTAVDIIDYIYKIKKQDEKFVLSSGHAGVALYVVLEDLGLLNNIDNLSSHPDRARGIDCSSGSLGHGLPIALGMALADRKKNVYCLITDGECAEGSIWESLLIAEKNKINNLKIYVNHNGWCALDRVNPQDAQIRFLKQFKLNINIFKTKVEQLPFLKGLDAHYHQLSKSEYKLAMRLLE